MSGLNHPTSAQATQSSSERPSRHRTRTIPGAYDQDTTLPTRSESLINTGIITESDPDRIGRPVEILKSSSDTPHNLTSNNDGTEIPEVETGPSFSVMVSQFLQKHWGEFKGKGSHWGEWKSEAFDKDGNRLTPFLGLKEFEAHLERCKGFPQPTGLSYATPTWANLLYTFAIRPGMDVITWKPIRPGRELDSHDMHLEIEGSVLCHIINLYEYEVTTGGSILPYDMTTPQVDFDCPFGQIQVATSQGQIEVKFKPSIFHRVKTPLEPFPNRAFISNSKPEGALREGKVPCAECHRLASGPGTPHEIQLKDQKPPREGFWQICPACDAEPHAPQSPPKASIWFDGDVAISRYLRCIREGASRGSSLSLEWDKKALSMRDLASNLTQNWSRVMMGSDPRSPLLLTPEWLEEASRIKRLITTNGGVDSGFADDLLETVSRRQAFYNAKNPKNPYTPVQHPELIKSLCMFSDQHFRLPCSPEPRPEISRQPGTVVASLGGAIEETLATYRGLQPGTWKHDLSVLGARKLQRVLAFEHARYNAHAKVLKFTPNSALWKGVYRLD